MRLIFPDLISYILFVFTNNQRFELFTDLVKISKEIVNERNVGFFEKTNTIYEI